MNIDLLNTGTPTAIAANFPNYEQPNGIVANGSLWLQNQVRLSNLSKVGTKLFASGSLAIDDSAQNASKIVLPGGDVDATPNGNQIVPSNVNYPGNNVVLTAAATSDGVKKTDLINDGWDKIGATTLGLDYSPTPNIKPLARDVEPFEPAKIDSPTNVARYRALTRNSANGVYINNRDDVEKIYNATTLRNEPMTQAQLVNMLVSPPVPLTNPVTLPADYSRTGTASTNAQQTPADTVSLEQRHLRGWVGPDEFLARGALVELIQNPAGAPALRVTYDARSDANPTGPDNNKTVRDANGNPQPGVYTQIVPWPSNGTLFAEGNLRIRGSIQLPVPPTDGSADRYPSLTVVSLNNIYIEGSLSVDNRTINDPTDNSPNPRQIPDPNRVKS